MLIHELLDFCTPAAFPERSLVLESYNQGLVSYHNQRWDEAIAAFEAALLMHPGDTLSGLYKERALYLKENNPGDDWDGVWVMESK